MIIRVCYVQLIWNAKNLQCSNYDVKMFACQNFIDFLIFTAIDNTLILA